MKRRRFLPNWPDIVAMVLLFSIALCTNLTYQKEAIINVPIRADAYQYFRVAYNLYLYGVYSTESPPFAGKKPQPNCRRPPGYPLFLYPFIATSETIDEFLNKATATQALIGCMTVIMTYIMARLCFASRWAFLAGLFTALSPHLVAMSHFLLTETLFTFTMMLASLLLAFSWQKQHQSLSLVAGVLFGYLTLIRPIALLLGPFMGSVYLFGLFRGRKWAIATRSVLLTQLTCLLIGYALIYTPYVVFRNRITSGRFSVSRDSAWSYFIGGSIINLRHSQNNDYDPEFAAEDKRMRTDKSFAVKILKQHFLESPWAYLKWYLGGKLFFMWRWDNRYNGDVYQYPMEKKGFHTHRGLHAIHTLMRWLHWPLYFLTLSAPVFLLLRQLRGTLENKPVVLMVPLLVFVYFAGLLTILWPLPRYAIPARPFAYILSVYGLTQVLYNVRRIRNPGGTDTA